MSQHINLIVEQRRAIPRSVSRSLLVLLAVTVIMLGYWQAVQYQNSGMRDVANQTQAQLISEKAQVEALKRQITARYDRAAIVAEIEKLKSEANQSQEIIARLQNSDLGARHGYMDQLVTVARVSESGVWITGVQIHRGGRSVRVEGRALRSDAVLKYAERLNGEFSPLGAQFTALEMTPVAIEGAKAAPSAVLFKLF